MKKCRLLQKILQATTAAFYSKSSRNKKLNCRDKIKTIYRVVMRRASWDFIYFYYFSISECSSSQVDILTYLLSVYYLQEKKD